MPGNLDFPTLDAYLEKALYFYDLPGLSVRIDRGGESYAQAVGWQDVPEKKPLRTDHVFHMGSVTKLFVGTAILRLAENGKLRLDETLPELLPWFSMADPAFRRITAAQLLSHTSGMPDVADYRWYAPETDEGALVRYLRSPEVTGARLLHPPEEPRFIYSNMAYEALGAIVAERSGMAFEDYVDQTLFQPLGMAASTLLTFERDPALLCTPHSKGEDNRIAAAPHFPYNRAHAPSSTLTATPSDLAKWGKAHLGRTVLSPESYDAAWTPVATVPNNGEQIGLAWFRREQNGHVLYGHEGTDDGFRASFWICPALDLHITVCCNLTGAPTKKICKELFDRLLS